MNTNHDRDDWVDGIAQEVLPPAVLGAAAVAVGAVGVYASGWLVAAGVVVLAGSVAWGAHRLLR